MKKVKGQPITGTNTEMQPRPGVLANQAKTSVDLQNRLTKAQQPFTNKGGAATTPVGSKASGGVSTMEPKILSGLKRTTPGVKALPSGGPIGQKKPINQSGQIGGRMGYPPPKRKAGAQNLSPVKDGSNFYGDKKS